MSSPIINDRIAPALIDQYDKLIATLPGIERKGDKIPYTSLNGHMFSYFLPDGKLALRLSKEERDLFLAKYPDATCISYGIIKKEYVAVPAQLFMSIREMKKYFSASYEHTSSLKPKPTKKAKPVKKR